ncbi:MAG: aminodeoxychorismate/anthranilate synthase component II [Planctomycetota bacterium]|nr:aminodeoxychorismate/anthranilate synthase component II [Planctomycetota bacterium]
MILLIDNYDSFTYNLVQALGALGADLQVHRNDRIRIDEIRDSAPERILISPGPGRPAGAGVSVDLVRRLGGEIPILGVCLGHQCIAEAFGGRVVPARRLVHGKTSPIRHDGRGAFSGMRSPFHAARYHSLAVEVSSLPPALEASAWSDDGELMALRHREMEIEGLQFHPESFLTPEGTRILENFLEGRMR